MIYGFLSRRCRNQCRKVALTSRPAFEINITSGTIVPIIGVIFADLSSCLDITLDLDEFMSGDVPSVPFRAF